MANGKAELIGQMFGVGNSSNGGNSGPVMPHSEADFARMTV